MKRVVAVLFAVVFAVPFVGCVSQDKYNELQNDYNHVKKALKEAENYQADLESRNKDMSAQLANLSLEVDKYKNNSSSADERIAELQKRLEEAEAKRKADDSPWSIVQNGKGTFSYRIDDSVLFDVGKSNLSARGKAALAKLAAELKPHNDRIQIEGHTDPDPVRVHAKEYPLGNIELGADRALTVWEELKRLGIPESRMSVASYGPYQPNGANDSEQGKAKNRRVDVTVLLPRNEIPGKPQAKD
ncbi:MAG: OmpA family protein [Planctomycetota bacterium]